MLANKDLNELLQIFIIIQQYNSTGINIMNAFELYENNCKSVKVNKIIAGVKRDVESGMKLPEAFAKHPKFFPSYITEMMRLNEGTGQAEDIYTDIVKTLEQEIDLRRSVGGQLSQMIYLGLILLITICIVIFVVLPSMGKMMTSLNMDLPLYVQVFIWIGDSLTNYWYLLLMIAGIVFLSGILFFKKYPDKLALLILHMPLYGDIAYYQLQYRFAMIFGLCKAAGIDTIKSLQYTKTAMNNVLAYSMLDKTIKNLSRYGNSLTEALKKSDTNNILDNSYFMIIQAGEKSDMAALMQMRANFYRKQLVVTSQTFSDKLNRLILTPTFVFLGIVVISVLAPMFNMMYQISSGGSFGM